MRRGPGVYSDAYIQRLLTLRLSRSTLRPKKSRYHDIYHAKSPSDIQVGSAWRVPSWESFGSPLRPPGDPQETPGSSQKAPRKLPESSQEAPRNLPGNFSGNFSGKLPGNLPGSLSGKLPGNLSGNLSKPLRKPLRKLPGNLTGPPPTKLQEKHTYITIISGVLTPDSSPLATRMLNT